MSRKMYPIRTKKDSMPFVLTIIGWLALHGVPAILSKEVSFMVFAMMSLAFICLFYFLVSLPSWMEMHQGATQILNRCKDYIEENKVKIGLFVRPSINKNNITLANKYCAVSFNISGGLNNVKLLDKVSGEELILRVNKTFYDILTSKNTQDLLTGLFFTVCKVFNYDITAEEVEKECKSNHPFLYKWKREIKEHKNLSLDINQASEAELTALPGVTIAKAKHAVKVRSQQKLFLTMNQFYEAINLDEEFIEQIQSKGNKVLLSDLPEYKRLEMQEE